MGACEQTNNGLAVAKPLPAKSGGFVRSLATTPGAGAGGKDPRRKSGQRHSLTTKVAKPQGRNEFGAITGTANRSGSKDPIQFIPKAQDLRGLFHGFADDLLDSCVDIDKHRSLRRLNPERG